MCARSGGRPDDREMLVRTALATRRLDEASGAVHSTEDVGAHDAVLRCIAGHACIGLRRSRYSRRQPAGLAWVSAMNRCGSFGRAGRRNQLGSRDTCRPRIPRWPAALPPGLPPGLPAGLPRTTVPTCSSPGCRRARALRQTTSAWAKSCPTDQAGSARASLWAGARARFPWEGRGDWPRPAGRALWPTREARDQAAAGVAIGRAIKAQIADGAAPSYPPSLSRSPNARLRRHGVCRIKIGRDQSLDGPEPNGLRHLRGQALKRCTASPLAPAPVGRITPCRP